MKLSPEVAARLRARVARDGLKKVSKDLRLAGETVAKCMADLDVRETTVTHVSVNLPSTPANDSGAPVGA